MPKKKKKKTPAEFVEGRRAYPKQIVLLRKEWPRAFPEDTRRVRPLVVAALATIAGKMGWSVQYTRGVLQPWKTRAAYCKAVLHYEKRFSLDGKESTEPVDDVARRQAQQTLEEIKQRNEARQRLMLPTGGGRASAAAQGDGPAAASAAA